MLNGTVSFITPHCVVEHQLIPLGKHDVTIPNKTTTKYSPLLTSSNFHLQYMKSQKSSNTEKDQPCEALH